MRIGIEAQRLFRIKKHGMDVVVLELIRNLQELDHQNEYVIFVKPDQDSAVIKESRNFRIVEVQGGIYPQWEQIALPKAARRQGCDILHCTSNTAPVSLNIPLVITLHDIIYMEGPMHKLLTGGGTAYQRFGNLYRRWNVPRVLRKASRIITVSNFEKERIGDFFRISGEKLRAVHNGVSSHFQPVSDPIEIARIKNKYALPDRYFFFLGNTVEKKNTPGTLKAFAMFRKETGLDIPLVMLDFDMGDLTRILEDIREPDLLRHIVLTGYVVNTDLPVIYALADLFLYTSYRESFGIPILEAQQSGTAVITSQTSSMPEVAGEGALLVDPYRPEEICQAMVSITGDPDLRSDLVRRGTVNAAKFSWRNMATDVLNIYRELGAQ